MRIRPLTALAWALVLAGLLRAFLLVAHQPLAGYANQYDMVRTSACAGYWPALPAPQRFGAHPEAPVTLYRYEPAHAAACYPATEVAIVQLAAQVSSGLHGGRETISLRAVGFAKVTFLALAVLVFAWALSAHPAAALFHGLVVAFVLCDPVATLWMNTLYTEFGALWSLYAVVAGLGTLALTPRRAWLVSAVLAVALVALAFSREQFALLGPALVAVAWPWLWYRSRHLTVAAFGVALVASAISYGLVKRPPSVREANRVDAYLGLVLPSSRDPAAALATLGLPTRCERMVGATWYLQRGDDVHVTCPEVLQLPSVAFLRLLSTEPETLLRSVVRVAPMVQAISPPYVGTLEGARFASIRDLPWWLMSPLALVIPALPLGVFEAMLLAGLLAAPLALVAAVFWCRPSSALHGTGGLVALMLGMIVAYAFATTVFGDGWAEAARHFLPGALALVSLLLALPVGAAVLWATRRERARNGALVLAAGIVAIAIGIVTAVLLDEWAVRQPLAMGVLDSPVTREVKGDLSVRGWALDPEGVADVEVRIGSLPKSARRYGDPAPDLLARDYPGYPDAAQGRFAVEFTAAELAGAGLQGDVQMRTLVRNRRGTTTEIDRRVLDIAR